MLFYFMKCGRIQCVPLSTALENQTPTPLTPVRCTKRGTRCTQYCCVQPLDDPSKHPNVDKPQAKNTGENSK